jgi:hypothetical protein
VDASSAAAATSLRRFFMAASLSGDVGKYVFS